MRHNNSYRKLGRRSKQRKALLRNMATSFVEHGRIKTTLPKAKELRSVVERLITTGRVNTLASRRKVAAYLFGSDSVKKVFENLSSRFAKRPGGYTRIVKLGERFGDGSYMCNLEFVDYHEYEGKKKVTAAASVSKAEPNKA